ncbi:hypothetical protein RvY_04855-2 [Ramazzottius varieornatus]|uniref:Uncharacterized protein n=1 Tax=Ramazzottius varieornatus TaxID=947166 RepID=A0A1D1V271_RAMVA|nr:hypothetical protein RvY_04855-2 [Ramazzottius varieornatus]
MTPEMTSHSAGMIESRQSLFRFLSFLIVAIILISLSFVVPFLAGSLWRRNSKWSSSLLAQVDRLASNLTTREERVNNPDIRNPGAGAGIPGFVEQFHSDCYSGTSTEQSCPKLRNGNWCLKNFSMVMCYLTRSGNRK